MRANTFPVFSQGFYVPKVVRSVSTLKHFRYGAGSIADLHCGLIGWTGDAMGATRGLAQALPAGSFCTA
jgi:hypothetical protein